jgi:hypothetical protein
MNAMPLVALTLAAVLSGCVAEPATLPVSATPSAPSLHAQDILVTDLSLRPLPDAAVVVDGQAPVLTNEQWMVRLMLPEGHHVLDVAQPGFEPATTSVHVPGPLVRVGLAAQAPDVQEPVALHYRTFVACSLNVLLPMGHACGLVDSGDAEGQWMFTLPPDVPERSHWRISYFAPEAGNYDVRIVTPDSGTAGTGGETIAVLSLQQADHGDLVLRHGSPGPGGTVPLDVMVGAKLVVFVRGSVASPEALQGTPAGYGIGAELNHEGDLFVQMWDPRGAEPPAMA